MIKAVLFDLDGTLLNREASLAYFVEQQYERLGSFLGQVSKQTYIKQFIELDAQGHVWKDKVYQKIVSEFEVTGISWEALLEDYVSYFHQYCIGFPGLEQMLQTLIAQKRLLGVITNGRSPFQMYNIEALGIKSYFSIILISDVEGIKKPDFEIFQRAVNRLGIAANEAVFVGDNPTVDIEAAQKSGMRAVWKKSHYWGHCASADAVCEKLEQIPSIVQDLELHL
jgi:putative hydrolase of the HAD superfamily